MSQVPREKMFEAELIHQQLERLQEQLSQLERQVAEVGHLKDALDKFRDVKDGEELLVPLAAGVFMRATATHDKRLRVNVGQGVIVEKTVDDVHKMLDEQITEMRKYEDELHTQFDQMLSKLAEIQKEIEAQH